MLLGSQLFDKAGIDGAGWLTSERGQRENGFVLKRGDSKTMLRLTSSILFICAIVVGAAACGDSKNNPTVDAPGGCGHLGCPEAGVTPPALTDPEGGQIIFEYIYFDADLAGVFGVPTANRVIAFFDESMTPQDNPLPTAGACNNLATTKGWPLYQGTPKTDLDVGTLTITGMKTDGTASTISVPKATTLPGTDAIGRPHDIYYQQVNGLAPMWVKPDSGYVVNFGGATSNGVTIPATTFDNRDADHPGIYLANTFTVNSPNVDDNGPLVAGTDYPVAWTPGTTSTSDTVLGVTWLVDASGSPTHMCPTLHSMGSFTIPGSAIAEFKTVAAARGQPTNKMILLRNAIIHHIARLPDGATTNKRRIDFLSVMCWAQLMDVQ